MLNAKEISEELLPSSNVQAAPLNGELNPAHVRFIDRRITP